MTNKRKPYICPYYMDNQPLKNVKTFDYLGVRLSSNLSWKDHCDKTSSKANRTLGLIRRTLKPCSQEVKDRAYKTFVRPVLEYASTAWNPHTNRDTENIEKIQRRAARFVMNDYRRSINSHDLVNTLMWESLEARRQLNQVTLLYKVNNGYMNINLPPDIKPSRRGTKCKFSQPYSSIDAYSYSPFVRSIRIWNKLSDDTITAKSLPIFKKMAMVDISTIKTPAHLKRL
jgi:hypothetical protein